MLCSSSKKCSFSHQKKSIAALSMGKNSVPEKELEKKFQLQVPEKR